MTDDIEKLIKTRTSTEAIKPSIGFASRILEEAKQIKQDKAEDFLDEMSFWDTIKTIFIEFNIKQPLIFLLSVLFLGIIFAFILEQNQESFGYLKDFFNYRGNI